MNYHLSSIIKFTLKLYIDFDGSHLGGSLLFNGAHLGREVDGVGFCVVLDAEAKISDGAGQVLLHQDVLRLEVAVRDSGLAYG